MIYKLKWPCVSPRLGENVTFLVNAVIYMLKWPHFSPRLSKSVYLFSQCCILQIKLAVFYNAELIGTKERCRRIKHAKKHFTLLVFLLHRVPRKGVWVDWEFCWGLHIKYMYSLCVHNFDTFLGLGLMIMLYLWFV